MGIGKLKEVDIRGYRNENHIKGRIKRATISKEPNGKYYVSVLYELPILKNIKKERAALNKCGSLQSI